MQNVINSNFTKNNDVIINTWYSYSDNVYLYNCSFFFWNNSNNHAQGYGNTSGKGLILNGGNMTVDYCTFEKQFSILWWSVL